jgi:large repetitive protein
MSAQPEKFTAKIPQKDRQLQAEMPPPKDKAMKTLIINVVLILLFSIVLLAQGTTQYVYDANGRLTHVISATGQVSVYEYDFAGNLTRIRSEQNPILLISNFSPGSGNIGSSVTIRGVGFSIIPAQNQVKFNGVSAVVLSSTLTELTVTVPIGATTGKVQVTNPIGTAISSSNFTVLFGIPTITSFSPTVGKIGDAVAINGSGFSDTAEDNTVKFNKGNALTVNSTTSLINTTVTNNATSGKISVTTDFGEGVSNDDFYVVPNGFNVADVAQTARLNYAQTYPVNIPTPKKLSLFVFEGTAGSKIHVDLKNVAGIINAAIKSPNNANVWQYATLADSFQENVSLPETGTYSIYIQALGTDPASVNLTLYQAVADINDSILTDGTPKTVNLAVGQNARLNFSVNQKTIAFSFQNVTVPNYSIKLFRENGQLIEIITDPTTYIDDLTGDFYISFNPETTSVGSATFTLQAITNINEDIQIDGTPKTVTINTIGQNARLNFSVGQTTLVLRFQDITVPNYSIKVFRDNGQLIQTVTNSPTNLIYLTGSFYILFNPQATDIGSATFTLQPIANISDIIETNGTLKTVNFSIPGRNAELTFSATAGQNFGLRISNASAVAANYSVVSPTNQTIYSGYIDYGFTGAVASFPTSETGTYKIVYDPQNAVTGSATFKLNLLNEIAGNLVINDPIKTFTSILAGQGFRINFAGNQGQRFYLKTTTSDFYRLSMTIKNPDNTDLITNTKIDNDTFIDINNLPQTGNYTLVILPDFPNQSGDLQLQAIDNNVFIANNPLKQIHAYFIDHIVVDIVSKTSKTKKANFTIPNATYNLNATANEVFSITTQSIVSSKPTKTPNFVNGTMTIFKPDGEELSTAPIDIGFCNLTLPVSGVYQIVVSPIGGPIDLHKAPASTTLDFTLRIDCGPPPGNRPKPKKGVKK